MKKNIKVLFSILLLFLISACTKTTPEQEQPVPEESIAPAVFQEEKIFGTYDVYDDWVFLEHYSDEKSAFYSKKGEDITNETSNISVEYRQNQYEKEKYDTLTSAILYQLKLELKEDLYENLITESFTSKNGYSVFRIEVNDEKNEPPVKTVQYYIAGEKAHILVQVTDFGEEESKNADEVAKNIVETFVWREFTV